MASTTGIRHVAILGSTGSIGQSALSVVAAHADRLRVVAMAAGENIARFVEQVGRFVPDTIAMSAPRALADARAELHRRGAVDPAHALAGPEGLIAVATHPEADVVLFASSGTAALDAVLAAIEARKTIALANKEILVMAGSIVMEAARRHGVAVLPVDSEHNAIHQCLHGRSSTDVRRLILTASGGPFRDTPVHEIATVTPEEALRHPTWTMGPKITIDSATLMNKGLEVIEARWLFDVAPNQIEVLVHPQSIVHSMVELVDGSIIAQLGVTDMRLPIQYAFSYPARWGAALPPLDLARAGRLDFAAPDTARFPCLALAFRALAGNPGLPIVLNAANEIAVSAFLDRRIGLTAIPDLIGRAMEAYEAGGPAAIRDLADVRAVDRWAREFAQTGAGTVKSRV
ncbi:MAG TPA: 1-deoxy-D-xylulose-5-phosphate reductoisomerase [Vicinamibacterales bacterium]|jgi:1-deoxy-D-xylulose-5-phosphate reductoisomerase|nr:1-deoxy-D-xylulose-5-phosphate reductoisomerase [Vicinamibacterales bacterium]